MTTDLKNIKKKEQKLIVEYLQRRARTIQTKLYKYSNIIYSDKSNEVFDLEHDNIYYHIKGYEETLNELFYDIENGISSEQFEQWKEVLNQDLKCANEIQAYFKAVTKSPRPKYIYG